MGWKLAEEIAWARPERPGPEWWTLLDIAQDARDETRQSMCGHEYLMQRGKCSKATLYRRLKALTDTNLIKVVRRSAPGIRAVYEVEVIHNLPETCLTIAETRTGLTIAETRSEPTGLKNHSNGSQKAFETGLSVSETHPVTTTPSQHPVTNLGPVVTTSVEGSELSTDQDPDPRPSRIEREALRQVAEARAARTAKEAL